MIFCWASLDASRGSKHKSLIWCKQESIYSYSRINWYLNDANKGISAESEVIQLNGSHDTSLRIKATCVDALRGIGRPVPNFMQGSIKRFFVKHRNEASTGIRATSGVIPSRESHDTSVRIKATCIDAFRGIGRPVPNFMQASIKRFFDEHRNDASRGIKHECLILCQKESNDSYSRFNWYSSGINIGTRAWFPCGH